MVKKRWLLYTLGIVLLLIIFAIAYGFFMYQGLLEQKEAGYDETMEKVLAETSLTEIDKKYKYFGEDNYHIYFGSTENAQEEVVFYPLNDENEIIALEQDDIISREDVERKWKNQCESCKLMNIRPAMEDDTPLWELTFKDPDEHLVLDYVSLEDGTDYEEYHFQQMFK